MFYLLPLHVLVYVINLIYQVNSLSWVLCKHLCVEIVVQCFFFTFGGVACRRSDACRSVRRFRGRGGERLNKVSRGVAASAWSGLASQQCRRRVLAVGVVRGRSTRASWWSAGGSSADAVVWMEKPAGPPGTVDEERGRQCHRRVGVVGVEKPAASGAGGRRRRWWRMRRR